MKGIWGKTAADKVVMKNWFSPVSVLLTVLSGRVCPCVFVWEWAAFECVFVCRRVSLHVCLWSLKPSQGVKDVNDHVKCFTSSSLQKLFSLIMRLQIAFFLEGENLQEVWDNFSCSRRSFSSSGHKTESGRLSHCEKMPLDPGGFFEVMIYYRHNRNYLCLSANLLVLFEDNMILLPK